MSRNVEMTATCDPLKAISTIWSQSAKESGRNADVLVEDSTATCCEGVKTYSEAYHYAHWQQTLKRLDNVRQECMRLTTRLDKLKHSANVDNAQVEQARQALLSSRSEAQALESQSQEEMKRFANAGRNLIEPSFEAFLDIQRVHLDAMKELTDRRCREAQAENLPESETAYRDLINAKLRAIRALSIVAGD